MHNANNLRSSCEHTKSLLENAEEGLKTASSETASLRGKELGLKTEVAAQKELLLQVQTALEQATAE